MICILLTNITKTYKKAVKSLPTNIKNEAKQIAKKFEIHDKLDIIAKRQCFFTYKDPSKISRTTLGQMQSIDCLI